MLVGEILPCPLQHHQQPVAEADEIQDVDAELEHPGDEAADPREAEVGDGE